MTPRARRLALGLGSLYFAAAAFNFATVARVAAGSAHASSSHPLQHRNTGWPFSISLTGRPASRARSPKLMAEPVMLAASRSK